jgi:hypothetical protein
MRTDELRTEIGIQVEKDDKWTDEYVLALEAECMRLTEINQNIGVIGDVSHFYRAMALEKEFKVQRLKNGRGHSHLVVITEPAIEDVNIGTVVIIPYAEGFIDPEKVVLQVDEKGKPIIANGKFGIVSRFIHEH